MRTSELIEALRKSAAGWGAVKTGLLKEAAERLEQLSTGSSSLTADIAADLFTHQELANLYDLRGRQLNDEADENRWLLRENSRLVAKCERLEKKIKSIRSQTGVWF